MAAELMDVTMPDGTVVTDVPVGTTQTQLMGMLKKHAAAAPAPKFEAKPDTQYSAEGIPLTSTGPDELPAWAQKVERGITDVMGAPIRAAVSIAKPIAGVAEWLGYGEPGKAVKALDEGIKSRTGIVSSAGSLAGDIAGFGALGKGVQLGAKALQTVPKIAVHKGP